MLLSKDNVSKNIEIISQLEFETLLTKRDTF
jgi:hypothetical protein